MNKKEDKITLPTGWAEKDKKFTETGI